MTEKNDSPLTPEWDALGVTTDDSAEPDDAAVEHATPVEEVEASEENTTPEEEEEPVAKKATKKKATKKKTTAKKKERLEFGASGKDVEEWQENLRSWRSNALPRGGVSGEFDRETYRWTRRFQSAHGISVDGVVGEQSRSTMEKALK